MKILFIDHLSETIKIKLEKYEEVKRTEIELMKKRKIQNCAQITKSEGAF